MKIRKLVRAKQLPEHVAERHREQPPNRLSCVPQHEALCRLEPLRIAMCRHALP